MKKTLTAIGVAFLTAIGTHTATAQPVPCPDCPPCTNCPPYTNAPFIPQEFPTNALLIREVQISTAGTVIWTGNPWILDTNNLLISGGGNWTSNPPTDANWTYVLAVSNSSPTKLYSIEYRSSLGLPGTNTSPLFVGATNGTELFFTNSLIGQDNAGFWMVNQQPGFIAWGHAANKPQGMGQFLGCPGAYSGFIDFTNGPVGGQYRIDTNYTSHSFTDFLRPTNSMQQWGGPYFECNNAGYVSVPNTNNLQAFTSWCRVFIMYQHDWPSNQDFPVWAQGFQSP